MPDIEDDFTNALTIGVMQLLADEGVGVYLESGTYATDDVAITGQVLPQTPDAALAVSVYGPSDDATYGDTDVSIQVLSRAAGVDFRDTNRLSDAVFKALQSLHSSVLPTGVHVQLIRRVSGALLGRDDNQRWIRSDNYRARVFWPGPNRL